MVESFSTMLKKNKSTLLCNVNATLTHSNLDGAAADCRSDCEGNLFLVTLVSFKQWSYYHVAEIKCGDTVQLQ